MLRVSGSYPCEGEKGFYQVWAHYLVGERMAQLMRYTLVQQAVHIEEWLEPPRIADPWKLIDLAERSGPSQRWIATRLGAPATASLVRVCHEDKHRDGAISDEGNGRLEAAARVVWVPPAAGRLAVHPRLAAFNDDGIGVAQPTRRFIGSLSPVVSVPLTLSEERLSEEKGRLGEVVETAPSVRPENMLYALLHQRADESALEQIFVVQPPEPPPSAA